MGFLADPCRFLCWIIQLVEAGPETSGKLPAQCYYDATMYYFHKRCSGDKTFSDREPWGKAILIQAPMLQ